MIKRALRLGACLVLTTVGCSWNNIGFTPSPIPSEMLTNTPTALATITATPTAIFTLSPQEQDLQHAGIVGLLENNGGCELPCFWGVTPGQSTLDESGGMLSSAGVYLYESTSADEISRGWVTYLVADGFLMAEDTYFWLQSQFVTDNEVVKFVRVDSNGSSDRFPPSPEFKQVWVDFAPEMIIA